MITCCTFVKKVYDLYFCIFTYICVRFIGNFPETDDASYSSVIRVTLYKRVVSVTFANETICVFEADSISAMHVVKLAYLWFIVFLHVIS